MDLDISYRGRIDTAIRDLLLEYECQPILFVGSGISKRYFSAPNWIELLRLAFDMLPNPDNDFEYYCQKFNYNQVEIGTLLSELIFEWAWKEGRNYFPVSYYKDNLDKSLFLKHVICTKLEAITPEIGDINIEGVSKEIQALALIKPHAVITTNYDLFLEKILPGYETITGQTILKYNTNSFGEIFHIHGDVNQPHSIVLTKQDYDQWSEKKKYVSAKLLTYFAEHPVFIFGYSMGDPNIKSILCDIGELVADNSGLISNVYQVFWQPDEPEKNPPEQAVIALDGKEFRTQAIHTNDLGWIFDALKSRSAITSINPKLVRALAARMMKLVRHDIPLGNVAVNYDVLERVANEKDHLPNLLGISTIENPNQLFPYTITQVAIRLKLRNWQEVNKIINQIKSETGIDIRSTDNKYHCKIKTGLKSSSNKWSNDFISLLQKIIDGEGYEINL